MFGQQVRRAFQRHRAGSVDVGGLGLGLGEAQGGQHVESGVVERGRRNFQHLGAEFGAERVFVEGELDVEGIGQRLFEFLQRGIVEALRPQGLVVDARRADQRAVATA